jgi:nickel-dependent lactate racemase
LPVRLNKCLREYDGIISVGVIEPHLYAGYSGGAKTIAIGLAAEALINATHNISFLDDPKVEIGRIEGNPFQDALWEIIRALPVIFSLNVVNSPDGHAVGVFAGAPEDVFKRGVSFAKGIYEIGATRRVDIVICGIGYPKDANLYQASRAINYIAGSGRSVLKDGGFLVIAAELSDGLGGGIVEKRCFEALAGMGPRVKEFVEKIALNGCVGGEHRAYMIAKAMLRVNVIFVGKNAPKVLKGLPLAAFSDMEGALAYIDSRRGAGSKVCVVPHALSTIVRMKEQPCAGSRN